MVGNINYKGTIILTEGNDDKNLIVRLLQEIYPDKNISEIGSPSKSDPIYSFKIDDKDLIIATHNTYSVKKFQETIKQIFYNTHFKEIQDILFIVDADDGENKSSGFINRKNQLNDLINSNIGNLPQTYKSGEKCTISTKNNKQIRCGYFILPNNRDNGSLETLLLMAAKNQKLLGSCIEEMYDCLNKNNFIKKKLTTNKKDKLMLRLYIDGLIANDSFHYDQTYKNELDFNHKCFYELKEFLG